MSYAGDLSVSEAWQLLAADPAARPAWNGFDERRWLSPARSVLVLHDLACPPHRQAAILDDGSVGQDDVLPFIDVAMRSGHGPVADPDDRRPAMAAASGGDAGRTIARHDDERGCIAAAVAAR